MDRLVLLGRRFVMGRMTVLNMRMDLEGRTRYWKRATLVILIKGSQYFFLRL